MNYLESDQYLVISDGQVRFTEQGIRDLGDYFSRVGIISCSAAVNANAEK